MPICASPEIGIASVVASGRLIIAEVLL